MTNPKRIVIIEGDAFDADAIVAIMKTESIGEFDVYIKGMDTGFSYVMADDLARDKAMALAIEAWRSAVGDMVDTNIVPYQPTPEGPIFQFWSDEKGRYYETYDGQTVFFGGKTGRFVWNEGPPRRKNPLGEGASPIGKIYVDDAGKPLEQQPTN